MQPSIQEEITNDAKQILENHASLHKYAGMDSIKAILENNSIAFSVPTSFNDPFDCYTNLISYELKDIPEDFVKFIVSKRIDLNEEQKLAEEIRLKSLNHTKEDFKEIFSKGIMPDSLNDLAISCFSLHPTKLLMWSHYANSHTGACLSFDTNLLYKSLTEQYEFVDINKVTYVEDFEPHNIFANQELALRKWLGTKSKEWEYEAEVRLCLLNVIKKGEKKAFINFDTSALKEIYLGCKSTEDDERAIIDICKQKYQSRIPIYKMETDPKGFRVLRYRIYY